MANPTVWPRPPISSNAALDRAGAAVKQAIFIDSGQYDLVNNWRAAHSFPLNTIQTNLRYRARKVDANRMVVTQRLKRLASIRSKLERRPSMRLSQMQDIGGCRAVVSDVISVRRLADMYFE